MVQFFFFNDTATTEIYTLSLHDALPIYFASNHVIDKGENGFRQSLQEIKKAGLECMGVQKQENQKKYTIKNINGIKVGIISYVYETEKINGRKTINGKIGRASCRERV